MRVVSQRLRALALITALVAPASASLAAKQQDNPDANIVVNGAQPTPPAPTAAGPEVKGIISARHADKIKVTGTDGSDTIIAVTDATQIKSGGGLFGGGSKRTAAALVNGLPVTVKTMQSSGGLQASQITFRSSDMRTVSMIRSGTAQQFDEQAAATEALRGRMGDIDKYNIKSTTNVYFDTGKAALSARAKADLCAAGTAAEGVDNALMLVVGYTDSTGSDEVNQALSERRAASVINYLQQVCHWKPYRMLTPTGMAQADPLASNDTDEGRAQNRRVSVNVLVSKGLDGI